MSESVLRDVILPAAFNKNGSKVVGYEFDKQNGAQDNFQSSVFFVTAIVEKKEGVVKIPLIVKFQPKDEKVRKEFNTGFQFYNEVFMYTVLIPFINKNNIFEDTFPTFYHGLGTLLNPENDVIVVEDLRPKGFKLADEKAFIDLRHLELAMEKLGKFHALSYVAKKENPDEFYKLVGKLKEPMSQDASWAEITIRTCFHRAMDPLVASGRHVAVLRQLLTKVDRPGGVARFIQGLMIPEEPMAVLCHGDFCRNNMLFSYSGATPEEVKFFDVATSRYSSPAVDISFFLLMNSSPALRAAHWDRLLTRYHTALSSTANGLSRDAEVPTLQRLQEEMKLKAMYGFYHTSFFLPLMLWGSPPEAGEMKEPTPEEIAEFNASLGCEEGTKLLSGMVEELVDRGCLTLDHSFLNDDN